MGGGPIYPPSIYCKDEVDTPGVYKQWPKRDVFEVQPTIDQFQPCCVCIDIRVVFDAVERLDISCCKFVDCIEDDKKPTLGQFATSSALVSIESSSIEMRRPRPSPSFPPQPSNKFCP